MMGNSPWMTGNLSFQLEVVLKPGISTAALRDAGEYLLPSGLSLGSGDTRQTSVPGRVIGDKEDIRARSSAEVVTGVSHSDTRKL